MTLEQIKKQYSDAVKSKITVEKKVLMSHNLYKDADLRAYLQPFFPNSSILYCSCSGRTIEAITSEEAFPEELRRKSMVPGTKVIMTGAEKVHYPDRIWTVTHGPQLMCGELVVWLDGFSGAYSCDCLEIKQEG